MGPVWWHGGHLEGSALIAECLLPFADVLHWETTVSNDMWTAVGGYKLWFPAVVQLGPLSVCVWMTDDPLCTLVLIGKNEIYCSLLFVLARGSQQHKSFLSTNRTSIFKAPLVIFSVGLVVQVFLFSFVFICEVIGSCDGLSSFICERQL